MKPNTLLAFITGALAGAAVALLYAPDKGANIRKKIKAKAEEEYYAAKEKLEKEARKAKEKFEGKPVE